jgi:hypothetical protein
VRSLISGNGSLVETLRICWCALVHVDVPFLTAAYPHGNAVKLRTPFVTRHPYLTRCLAVGDLCRTPCRNHGNLERLSVEVRTPLSRKKKCHTTSYAQVQQNLDVCLRLVGALCLSESVCRQYAVWLALSTRVLTCEKTQQRLKIYPTQSTKQKQHLHLKTLSRDLRYELKIYPSKKKTRTTSRMKALLRMRNPRGAKAASAEDNQIDWIEILGVIKY